VRERQVEGDGNCQFRALADQLYGSQEHHLELRAQVVAQLRKDPGRFKGFVPGSFEDYVADMALPGTWGDHVTLQAAADAFGVQIHVFTDHLLKGGALIEVQPREQRSAKVLQVTFWAEVHYNSVAG